MKRLEKTLIPSPTTSTTTSITLISPSTLLTTHYDGSLHFYKNTSTYLNTVFKHIESHKIDLPILCCYYFFIPQPAYNNPNYNTQNNTNQRFIFLGTPINLSVMNPQTSANIEIHNKGIFQILNMNNILICVGFDECIYFYDISVIISNIHSNIMNFPPIKILKMKAKINYVDFNLETSLLAVSCINKYIYTIDLNNNFQEKCYSVRLDYGVATIKFLRRNEVAIGGVEGRVEILKLNLSDTNTGPSMGYSTHYNTSSHYNKKEGTEILWNIEKSFSFKSHRSFQEAHCITHFCAQKDLLITGGNDGKIIIQNIKERSKVASCSFSYGITSLIWEGDLAFVGSGENFAKGVYSGEVGELWVVECAGGSFY
ncbi:hypothetical protein CDIK_1661 [Cucumispora dikerogammari]|nr:hypothetical protein CDIK_1661 [Cucumispora dikerogammari]